jgi:tryptophanyl-tRNA synthetase
LQNWVRLQNDPAYECFYFIADWHALTSDYADTSAIAENTLQIMIDYLAAGLDPQKSVIFQQSVIPEHAELHLLLSMVTPLGWLERVPTYKEALDNVKDKDLHNYGFLGYPVLQTADIVIYTKEGAPLVVPVGEDQVSHVEISREIVRRFNLFYGFELDESLRSKSSAGLCGNFCLALGIHGNTPSMLDFPLGHEKWAEFVSRVRAHIVEIGINNAIEHLKAGAVADMVKFRPVLEEPEAKLTLTPRIPGTDGRKMSKSYGNAITLSESDAEIRTKTKVMVTDPARKRRTDPGNPDVCPVYDWHKLFSTRETLKWAAEGCRTAGIGCIECKAKMADHLIEWIAPVRERRVDYEKHPARVLEILDEGSKKARKVAKGTMERVRESVFGWEKKRGEIGGAGAKA